jgi:processing peptidase subunit beta
MWIDAGSRAETDKTNGTAHFLEHLAFKVWQKNNTQSEQMIDETSGHWQKKSAPTRARD